MKNLQRKQALVKLANNKEGDEFIEYLEINGFTNLHNITFNKLRVKVLVVDSNSFFSASVTGLAALSGCGIKPMSVDEFITRFEKQTEATTSL